MPKIPVLASEWQILFQPRKTGCYVNDHSVIRGRDGRWHLFGITQLSPEHSPEQERYFAHGSGEALFSAAPWVEHGPVCDDGTRAWAPGVAARGNRYFMYYGPSPTRLAVSRDLYHWMGETPVLAGAPLEACHRDHMIFQLEESTWLMYATGLDEEGLGGVSVFVSRDLVHWQFERWALRTTGATALRPAWGATESPFAFFHEGHYYLSITYTDCRAENYQDTLIFRSEDPRNFGCYDADRPAGSVVHRMAAHAPEYLCDQGEWYVTTCGWPGYQIPHEGAVSIARLDWR